MPSHVRRPAVIFVGAGLPANMGEARAIQDVLHWIGPPPDRSTIRAVYVDRLV